MSHQRVIVLNLGGSGAKNVAQRVRECGVYCEVYPWNSGKERISSLQPMGVIVTGGLRDVPQERLQKAPWLTEMNLPVLEIGQGTALSVEALSGGEGKHCLNAFLKTTCDCVGDWSLADYMDEATEDIRRRVGEGRVVLAMSGDTNSAVVAGLLSRAIGDRLICLFTDNGFLRKNEPREVTQAFEGRDMTFVQVNAGSRFLFRLLGVSDPAQKRRIIKEEFERVLESEIKKLGGADYLAQGVIYDDRLEGSSRASFMSGMMAEESEIQMDIEGILEPLSCLFKEEVRRLGEMLGLSEFMLWRQPFPVEGLAVRCVGAISKERLDILREADHIFRREVESAGLQYTLRQYFTVITDMKSVGIRNQRKTHEYTIVLRAINEGDGSATDWAELPTGLLRIVSRRITTEVAGVNRVLLDVTNQPPAMIEWE